MKIDKNDLHLYRIEVTTSFPYEPQLLIQNFSGCLCPIIKEQQTL